MGDIDRNFWRSIATQVAEMIDVGISLYAETHKSPHTASKGRWKMLTCNSTLRFSNGLFPCLRRFIAASTTAVETNYD